MSDGQWSSTPRCVPIDCGAVPQRPNAVMTSFSNCTTVGCSAQYTCVMGYRSRVDQTIRCTAGGWLKDSEATCSPIDCGVLEVGLAWPGAVQLSLMPRWSCAASYLWHRGELSLHLPKRRCVSMRPWVYLARGVQHDVSVFWGVGNPPTYVPTASMLD